MRRFWKDGDPFIWLTGSALALSLIMVGGLLLLILWNGLGVFWPKDLILFAMDDDVSVLGQVTEREKIPGSETSGGGSSSRIQIKRANRDVHGADFIWIDEARIARRERPPGATVLERREWGNLFGFIEEVRDGDRTVASGPEAGWAVLQARLPEALRTVEEVRAIEKSLSGKVEGLEASQARIAELRGRQAASVIVATAGGEKVDVPLSVIVRAYRPNAMGITARAGFFAAKFWEFISDDPRESNTEGGIFPAIFGTVFLVILMSLLTTPFGVIAAFYLREYAKQGTVVSIVRIAVNNLAGVPSIVFGVFGVGFFIYLIGGSIDRFFFSDALPSPTYGTGGILWASLTLALLTVPVVIVATEEGLAAIPRGMREASLALGATRAETMVRVVLPAVMPSVLTGLILAMARAAGEVAPLMITGVVKLAPALPIDGTWPFIHLERKFMHLGFHIYDVGFQSPNVDMARPMVYMTTFLLVGIVLLLNLAAIVLRNRLRKKYSLGSL
jgi:phosphate transport system permease protein